jgi:3-deoxy-7-phosphoheptulonate synthase
LAIIGGPCGVESKEQVLAVARYIAESGVGLFRAGAFKPRTDPYSFQGLGPEGLALLALVKQEFHLGIVTEATDLEAFPGVEKVADVVQVGARNMQNFALLRRAGKSEKPILLKRGQGATLEEWLLAAEYILSEGNCRVILCERGIRTWSNHARNTFDVSVIPAARALSHLPVIADPSHATGRRDLVIPCALAGVAAGADGILVETHCQPSSALSDGQQALLPNEFLALVDRARKIRDALHSGEMNVGLCF